MNNRIFNFGPIALSSTLTTNILNPATITGGVNSGSGGTYIIISHFKIVSKTASAVTCSFWKGATGANAAGTEFLASATSVPANGSLDFYGLWRFDITDFMVGGASSLSSLTIEGEGEIGVAG